MNGMAEIANEGLRNPWAAGTIFLISFIMISVRRMNILPIGRPSAAMLGAVLMVVAGVVTPEEAYRLVNWDTICLLLGMMIIAEHLRAAGLFQRFTRVVARINSPFALLLAISFVAALSSAILVNDPVCVVLTPLVLEICRHKRFDPLPFLVVLATSANIGSALTLTGNPQNMIIGSVSGLDYLKFMALMMAPVAAAMLINISLAWLFYRSRLVLPGSLEKSSDEVQESFEFDAAAKTRRLRIGLLGLALACFGFVSGFSMAFSALAGAAVVITFHRKDPTELLDRVEWSLLLFFASLFVVIGGLQTSGLAKLMTDGAMKIIEGDLGTRVWNFSGVTLIGSNILSNVPFVLLVSPGIPALGNPEFFWSLLAFVSTIAGNMTLFSSVANLIVAETARNECSISFWEFARFGIPTTLISIFFGILILMGIFATAHIN